MNSNCYLDFTHKVTACMHAGWHGFTITGGGTLAAQRAQRKPTPSRRRRRRDGQAAAQAFCQLCMHGFHLCRANACRNWNRAVKFPVQSIVREYYCTSHFISKFELPMPVMHACTPIRRIQVQLRLRLVVRTLVPLGFGKVVTSAAYI